MHHFTSALPSETPCGHVFSISKNSLQTPATGVPALTGFGARQNASHWAWSVQALPASCVRVKHIHAVPMDALLTHRPLTRAHSAFVFAIGPSASLPCH